MIVNETLQREIARQFRVPLENVTFNDDHWYVRFVWDRKNIAHHCVPNEIVERLTREVTKEV